MGFAGFWVGVEDSVSGNRGDLWCDTGVKP